MKRIELITRAILAAGLLSVVSVDLRTDTGGSAAIDAALNHPDRPAPDRGRDVLRKPATVLSFLGIKPGMRVLELLAGGGYYTEILARILGPNGELTVHNNEFFLSFNDRAAERDISTRLNGNRLPNARHYIAELNALDLPNDYYDVVTLISNYHDGVILYTDDYRARMLTLIYGTLKPGGVFGIVDHAAGNEEADPSLHRVSRELVIAEVTAVGFVADGEDEALRNPDDDHSQLIFNPRIRGRTDRFILRFRKPKVE